MAAAADRHLLFGLLALQNGLIDQGQLVAAFHGWTRDKSRGLGEHLVALGHLAAAHRPLLEALAAAHLTRHDGDVEKSLAAVRAEPSTRESLGHIDDREIDASLGRVGLTATQHDDAELTATYSVGMATSDGQRFRVLRPHAKGGLGAVFVALDGELHREVALKQILDSHADDSISRQRFLQEAEITGGLEHPGIVPVYGLGTYGDGRPFYAMRFIRGDSLKEAIERFHGDEALKTDAGRRSLELRKLLRRFLDVCNAIDYAHGRGVLHRDIKPGNIIVGRHGETLVVDWGLAKASGKADLNDAGERPLMPSSASGSAETLPGSALGTPAYMSPEQAGGDLEHLGPRSDVYSLGATLYCLLTGRAPFEGDDVGAVLRAVQRGEYRAPRQVDPGIDRALEAVCQMAMALAPENRYPLARGLADDIERWMADEPVSCWREPVGQRVARWGRRHRPLVAGAAMLMVSAVVALGVGAVLINRERTRAESNFRQARAAVDEYFTMVSESKLLNVPGLQPLRKELLDAAQRYYREFLSQRERDPSVRFEAASASFRVGWINLEYGQVAEAIVRLQAATAMFEDLVRSSPGDFRYRQFLATGYGALGLALPGVNRRDEAMAAHGKALAIRERLARDVPSDVLAKNDVARTHRNIGTLHRETGKTAEALAEWEQASTIAQALLKGPLPRSDGRIDLTGRSEPSVIIREDLGSIMLDRASILREVGRLGDAERNLDNARDVFESLAREQPETLRFRSRLADIYQERADFLIDTGRIAETVPLLRRGLEIYEGLAADNPSVLFYRSAVAGYLSKLSWVLWRLGRTPEAVGMLARSVEIAEELVAEEGGSGGYLGLLSLSLGQSGNLLLATGRTTEALAQLRRSLELRDALARAEPGLIGHEAALTSCLRGVGRAEAAAGQPHAALAAFKRASEIDLSLAEKYPSCRYNLACSLALMIPVVPPDGREVLVRRTVSELRRTWKEGYANFALVKDDKDFDAMRSRPEFRDFILDMAFPGDPFAG